jgi:outer membrane protein OmpA-like peptidoglycan-associated protein
VRYSILFAALPLLIGADIPESKDPPNMKRYEGSEIIGYRAPKFEEYLVPLSPPTEFTPPSYPKSVRAEGQVSRYTYLAPMGRTGSELLRNYRLEFQRLGYEIVYQKGPENRGWFGPTYDKIATEDGIGQILAYNEASERMLVGKSKQSAYLVVFVTEYKDGVIPEQLAGKIQKGQALAEIVAIFPDTMEKKMTFVNADQMKQGLGESGKVALYGVFFDTDQDVVKAESAPTLQEIAQLLKTNPGLRLHVVGHTDNQGKADHNLDLSRRRAANVQRELTSKFGVAADRLDSFGCGPYSPQASNGSDDGRAKNRRVELVQW